MFLLSLVVVFRGRCCIKIPEVAYLLPTPMPNRFSIQLICLQRIYNFLIPPCYYIICFGCLMGFNMFFYIIFGTNLLNGGLVPVSVFLPILEFRRKGISKESKRNETFGSIIFGTNVIQETWSGRQGSSEAATR